VGNPRSDDRFVNCTNGSVERQQNGVAPRSRGVESGQTLIRRALPAIGRAPTPTGGLWHRRSPRPFRERLQRLAASLRASGRRTRAWPGTRRAGRRDDVPIAHAWTAPRVDGARPTCGAPAALAVMVFMLLPGVAVADSLVSSGSPSSPYPRSGAWEPDVAIDPGDPAVRVAGAIDDLDSGSCSGSNCANTNRVTRSGVYFSFDSGSSWSQPAYTGYSARTGSAGAWTDRDGAELL
jgi:hypothetical protein